MNGIIEIRDLRKRFGKTRAVDGLTLTAPAGSVTAFLGPNGAGKTTTIKCILNLLRPDGGQANVLGCDSRKLGSEQFQRIGYVSENQELPLWMTVQQLIDYCRPMYPTWDAEFAAKLLADFDLPLGSKLKALSRGMRMKAALLSSLAYRPSLVVLDEPFSGLDALVRDEFIRGLLELTEQEGWSVFVSSHDIGEVERLADHVAIIDRGQLKLAESAEALQARFRMVEVVLAGPSELPSELPPSWLNAEASGRAARFTESEYSEPTLGERVSEVFGADAQSSAEPMSLRDIFVALARTYRMAAWNGAVAGGGDGESGQGDG